jgi:predicted unusual protein kinase regulating ubiquinone biosynthesis (AarF/ABC1/UbiB family)
MPKPTKVPSSSLSRLSVIAGISASVASNAFKQGIKNVLTGRHNKISELLLHDPNLHKIADGLSHLRGAAMKIGQLLSMDGGQFLPSQLTELLTALQAKATPMPTEQLLTVLHQNLGDNWRQKFISFDLTPFASASIGQVHLAQAKNGEVLAVKIQYPGIKTSIHSDIDNVGRLIRISGLLPKHIELAPILSEAKRQLLDETNYQREAHYMQHYQQIINGDDNFIIPQTYPSLCTESVLSSQYVQGLDINDIENLPQQTRNNLVSQLIALLLKELFNDQLMQTDPNAANYLYNQAKAKLVLLDFGATRKIPLNLAQNYKQLINGLLKKDDDQIISAAKQIGFLNSPVDPLYYQQILSLMNIACQPLQCNSPFNFANQAFADDIKSLSLSLHKFKNHWQQPPIDCMFIHRKIAGIYLLASKLKARVNCYQLFSPYAD